MDAVHGLLGAHGPRSVLIPGSGPHRSQDWEAHGYTTTYLDIDPGVNPDICASMVAMGEIGPFDAIFCCHALEHLYPHEISRALGEFKRVLNPGGFAIIIVPDLEDVRPDGKVLMDYGEGGKICGLHLFYGDAARIEEFPFMAHHSGFISETLTEALQQSGFDRCESRRLSGHNLLGIGIKA